MSNFWENFTAFVWENQAIICIGLAVLVGVWLMRDRRRQKQWREEKEAKIEATKARIAAKRRAEKKSD